MPCFYCRVKISDDSAMWLQRVDNLQCVSYFNCQEPLTLFWALSTRLTFICHGFCLPTGHFFKCFCGAASSIYVYSLNFALICTQPLAAVSSLADLEMSLSPLALICHLLVNCQVYTSDSECFTEILISLSLCLSTVNYLGV